MDNEADIYSLFAGTEPTAQQQAKLLADALRKQRGQADTQSAWGNLGVLTGDKVLSGFGQAQLGQAQNAYGRADQREGMLAQSGGMRFKEAMDNARAVATAKAKGADQNFDVEKDLRNKLLDNQETKNILAMNGFYKQIAGAPADGAGDLSMIYGLAKMWDPGGRVTDSDAENAAKTGGLPGQLQARYNEIMARGSLSDEARANMKKEAARIRKTRLQSYQPMRDSFTGLAKNYGVDPARVVFDLGLDDDGVQAAAPQEGPSMSGEDTEALNWARQNPNNPKAKAIMKSLGVAK